MNDIYSYLNSKDVEEHCRSIGHKVNSLESCFIINDCYSISVQEKHRLFREIMETMPDSALSDRMTNDLGYSSFYAALKKTIEAEEHYLELLKHGGSNMVYTYKYRDEKMNDYYEENYIFSTYDTALRSMYKDIMCEMESEPDLEYFGEMTMRELDSGKYIVADFDKNGSIIRIYGSYVLESSEENEIFDWLRQDGLEDAFETVILSSVCHIRKPDPEMYRMGCRELGLAPEECASVADNLNRDITGAKRAGIGANILFISPEKLAKKTITDENRPDYIVHRFTDILELPVLRGEGKTEA